MPVWSGVKGKAGLEPATEVAVFVTPARISGYPTLGQSVGSFFLSHLLQQVLRIIELFRVEETMQLTDTRGMAHLTKSLGLDLPDAFPRDFELFADLFQRATIAVDQPETKG